MKRKIRAYRDTPTGDTELDPFPCLLRSHAKQHPREKEIVVYSPGLDAVVSEERFGIWLQQGFNGIVWWLLWKQESSDKMH